MIKLTKKKALGLTLALSSAFILAACGGGGDSDPSSSASASGFVPGGDISVVNAESGFYKDGIDSPSAVLSIYAAKGKGDVPYANVNFLETLLSGEGMGTIQVKVEGKAATLTSNAAPNSKAVFDAGKNQISLHNYSAIYGAAKTNNGLGFDYCQPKNSQGPIATSKKTKLAVEGSGNVTIDLDKYGLKIYEQGGSLYAPIELLAMVGLTNSQYNFVFNGKDFFKDPGNSNTTALGTYCYSGNDAFYMRFRSGGESFGIGFKKTTTKADNEKYRYGSLDNVGSLTDFASLVLYKDGTGKMFEKVDGVEKEREVDGKIWRMAYEETKDTLIIYVQEFLPGSGDDAKASKESCTMTLRINTGKTHFALAERSQAIADYTYGLTCLNFDHFYGNKEFVTKDGFDAYFNSKGLKDRLKSTNVATYSDAMAEFLFKNVGDGHTAVLGLSSYQPFVSATIDDYRSKYNSERVKAIGARTNDLMAKRYEGLGHGVGYNFADIKGDTAMISFDQFISQDGMPTYFRNYQGMESTQLINIDTCGFVADAIMDIENYNANKETTTKVKNVVIDLTCNGGGAMLCMPYIAGIVTKDPTFYVKDVTSGKVTEYHYECDFDGDGKYGDTYADKYDFFVLVSSASFSCGTAFPGMLKGTNVKIIGEKSAGGASPVTHFTDGSGLPFQTSGSDIVCYKDGTSYNSVEEGVPVDYEIPESIWYDLEQLGAKLNTLKNQ